MNSYFFPLTFFICTFLMFRKATNFNIDIVSVNLRNSLIPSSSFYVNYLRLSRKSTISSKIMVTISSRFLRLSRNFTISSRNITMSSRNNGSAIFLYLFPVLIFLLDVIELKFQDTVKSSSNKGLPDYSLSLSFPYLLSPHKIRNSLIYFYFLSPCYQPMFNSNSVLLLDNSLFYHCAPRNISLSYVFTLFYLFSLKLLSCFLYLLFKIILLLFCCSTTLRISFRYSFVQEKFLCLYVSDNVFLLPCHLGHFDHL